MFHKLHRQMTFFCAAVTGMILILLTLLCLWISEQSLEKNHYASFQNETNSVLTHLQLQDVISLQWVNQLAEKNHFELLLYDNGSPLYLQQLGGAHRTATGEDVRLAVQTAADSFGLNIFSSSGRQLAQHAEFTLSGASGTSYYVSAGTVSKAHGTLSFLLFYPRTAQNGQLLFQRLAFFFADLLALLLLTAFSWQFTGYMLRPLEENVKRQSAFVASASHELRTPLAVMRSGIEALQKASGDADRAHFMSILMQENLRMQRLVSDMLILTNSDARSLSLHETPCQPDELLLAAYEKYELLAADKGISLKITLPDDASPTCSLDADRIGQVLSVLLDNALSYTPAGGTVTLSLSYDAANGQTAHSAAKYIRFTVSDSGCGVPDDDKTRIFDRFYRAEQSHTSKDHYGLGLCIAKEIVTAYRGKIFVTDAPEGGACFSVVLPRG